MAIYEFEGKRPKIASSCFIHPEATIIGDVVIDEGCYVGAGARIRGDWGAIRIGPGSNIQENCVIHSNVGLTTRLEAQCHIGHGAILHTVNLHSKVFVGMGAILLDDVTVGEGSFIAAGALIPSGTSIPPMKFVMGVPGRIVKDVDKELREHLDHGTKLYQQLVHRNKLGLILIADNFSGNQF